MPTITGTWRNGTRGNWVLRIPTRVTGYDGTEILPAGVFARGDIDSDPATLSVTVPSSADTLPAGWQPVLDVSIYNGGHERYVLDVSGGDVDLGTYTLPAGVVTPTAAELLDQAIAALTPGAGGSGDVSRNDDGSLDLFVVPDGDPEGTGKPDGSVLLRTMYNTGNVVLAVPMIIGEDGELGDPEVAIWFRGGGLGDDPPGLTVPGTLEVEGDLVVDGTFTQTIPDTGWLDLSQDPTHGDPAAGEDLLVVRRRGTHVWAIINGGSTKSDAVAYLDNKQLPLGFRLVGSGSYANYPIPVLNVNDGTTAGVATLSTGGWFFGSNVTEPMFTGTWEYETDDAWPDPLPGVPA